MSPNVSALYVRQDGPYPSLVLDYWTEERDARKYAGPNPAILHPPCARWSNLWWSARHLGKGLGDDDGCFAAALSSVQRWGGVLEHPAGSRAWPAFGLTKPNRDRWVTCHHPWSWVTEVYQRHYGHRALKKTWLYFVGPEPFDLNWGEPAPPEAYVTADRPMAELKARGVELMGKRERALTPVPFAKLLIELADTCNSDEARPKT